MHPCVMPETTSPPTETPSSPLGEPDRSLHYVTLHAVEPLLVRAADVERVRVEHLATIWRSRGRRVGTITSRRYGGRQDAAGLKSPPTGATQQLNSAQQLNLDGWMDG